jgi:hypothetical protein
VTETKNTVLKNTVYLGDNLAILQSIRTESIIPLELNQGAINEDLVERVNKRFA